METSAAESSGLITLFGHVAALASIGTDAPVVVLLVSVPFLPAPVNIHHGTPFAPPRLSADGLTEAPPCLEDGTRLSFQHIEPVIARDGRQLGTLRLYDVVQRRLSNAQRQLVSRLARQAADAAGVGQATTDANPIQEPSTALRTPGSDRHSILEVLSEGVLLLDPRSEILWCNAAADRMLGARPTGPRDANLWEHLPEAVGGPLHTACERVRRTGVGERVEDFFPIRSRRAETRIEPDGSALILLVRDVTDARAVAASLAATEAQLKALSQRYRTAHEDERRRLSRELHDVVGQDLSVIKLRLEILKKRLAKLKGNATNVELCQDIIHDTEDALAAARTLAQELRPSILDQLGLNAAIEWQAQQLQRRTGILCNVRTEATDVRQNNGRDTTAFRVIQELLTNVVRHSDARRVDILLTENHGSLLLEVQDDGRGFPQIEDRGDSSPPHDGLGLQGVRERVGAVGGNVEIESKEGKGTRIRVTLPPATEIAE